MYAHFRCALFVLMIIVQGLVALCVYVDIVHVVYLCASRMCSSYGSHVCVLPSLLPYAAKVCHVFRLCARRLFALFLCIICVQDICPLSMCSGNRYC